MEFAKFPDKMNVCAGQRVWFGERHCFAWDPPEQTLRQRLKGRELMWEGSQVAPGRGVRVGMQLVPGALMSRSCHGLRGSVPLGVNFTSGPSPLRWGSHRVCLPIPLCHWLGAAPGDINSSTSCLLCLRAKHAPGAPEECCGEPWGKGVAVCRQAGGWSARDAGVTPELPLESVARVYVLQKPERRKGPLGRCRPVGSFLRSLKSLPVSRDQAAGRLLPRSQLPRSELGHRSKLSGPSLTGLPVGKSWRWSPNHSPQTLQQLLAHSKTPVYPSYP